MRLDLSDPKDARKYVEEYYDFYMPNAPSAPTYIETNTGRRIEFASMSDDEACLAAHLLHDMVLEAGRLAIKH